ncbi:LacI family transcriptional regulator [Paenibacillus whitsoniae]|uniref:LacI family transcriptional regulator n=1 Tax=Paenibacillus whitsoniae TaxID=2496558 RepID=A0A3S0A6P3_9BACL|nr:LacI family transcriptional regulator [Paenibacillus whitsoniae]RTE10862.1 LacI family transcriptional regulator [Paenibacillus whitsoniae]
MKILGDSVGIVLPDMTNPYFMEIARAIQHRCFQEGYHLLFVDAEESADKEKEAIKFLLEKRIEALILAGVGQQPGANSAAQRHGHSRHSRRSPILEPEA